jgi:hypothetical protein
MPRRIVFTPNAAKPPATYSQAVIAAGLVFVSGTGPSDPATGVIVGDTIQAQTRQCLTNIAAILEAAGSSIDKGRQRDGDSRRGRRFRRLERGMGSLVPEQSACAPGRKAAGEDSRSQGFDCRDRRGLTRSAPAFPDRLRVRRWRGCKAALQQQRGAQCQSRRRLRPGHTAACCVMRNMIH